LQSLAEGGFGKTSLAEDTQMPSRRKCVIKQLKSMSDRPGIFAIIQQRFSREAAVLESVSKGNDQIPDLYAYFSKGDQFYLMQEWVEGQPLSAVPQNAWTDLAMTAIYLLTGRSPQDVPVESYTGQVLWQQHRRSLFLQPRLRHSPKTT